jgi:hypothetical protein
MTGEFKIKRNIKIVKRCYNFRFQGVDFASGQGLRDFETTGIVTYFEDFKTVKTQEWSKRCRLKTKIN